MKIILSVMIALLVVAALVTPMLLADSSTASNTQSPVTRIATEPTPTPTRTNGQGGCTGGGC